MTAAYGSALCEHRNPVSQQPTPAMLQGQTHFAAQAEDSFQIVSIFDNGTSLPIPRCAESLLAQ